MVKKKRFHNRPSKLDEDLDVELDEYEPSDDSDDDYNDNEKMLLENRTKGRSQNDDEDESEEEVLKIRSSDDDDDDEEEDKEDGIRPVGSDMDSDIEGKEDNDNLPDPKAWGKRRKDFYHTDYVDEDYGGFTRAEEEEAALLEEKEARVIQDRLLAELDDTDFSFGLISQAEKKEESKEPEEEVIKTDLSKLSKREKLALLEKESPEFMGLVSDFKERLLYAKDKLYPILELVKSGELPDCTAAEFVSTKYHITLNYCTNIAFYLLLKAKRINIQTHPVVKRLVQYRKLLEQLDTIEKDTVKPQIETILQMKQEGKRISVQQPQEKTNGIMNSGKTEKKRKMLQLLSEKNQDSSVVPAKKLKKTNVGEQPQKKVHFKEQPENSSEDEDKDIIKNNEYDDDDDNNDSSDEDVTVPTKEKGLESDKIGKRGITFEIAKNKGLTPRRKKEQRNPRVKNRNKYRKAKIRRKGQVREPRTEMSRYAGEMFGIKASVKKSIKLS